MPDIPDGLHDLIYDSAWKKRQSRIRLALLPGQTDGGNVSAHVAIVDKGTGQPPSKFADTFCSLNGDNKNGKPWLQGRFNQGGAGVLVFGSQLIVSIREGVVGWTFVWRHEWDDPSRNDSYVYLAPQGAGQKPHNGDVLSFDAESLFMLPDWDPDAEVCKERHGSTTHGSVFKVYDYFNTKPTLKKFRRDLGCLIPKPVLPGCLYQCIPGHDSSHDPQSSRRSFIGLANDIDLALRDQPGLAEEGFPLHVDVTVDGCPVELTVFGLKDKGKTQGSYWPQASDYGFLCVVDGQTHMQRGDGWFDAIKLGGVVASSCGDG